MNRTIFNNMTGIQKFLAVYLLLQPLLDILAGFSAEAGNMFSISSVVRALFMLFAVGYIIFAGKYPRKGLISAYLAVIALYLLVYALYFWNTQDFGLMLQNLAEAVKTFYFVFALLLFMAVYQKQRAELPLPVIVVYGSIYCLVILIAFVTNTSYITYNAGYGICGWFYSANDISMIISICGPLILALLFCTFITKTVFSTKTKVFYALAVVSLIFSALSIGTKLAYLSILLFLVVCAVWFALYAHKNVNRRVLICSVISLVIVAIMIGFYSSSPLRNYMKDIYLPMSGEDPKAYQQSISITGVRNEDRAGSIARMEVAAKDTLIGDMIEKYPLCEKINWVLSNRLKKVAPVTQEYIEQGPSAKLLGLGYVNLASYSRDISKLIELEPASLLLRHGLIGFAVYLIPWLVMVFCFLFRFIKNFRKCISDYYCCCYFFVFLLSIVSCIVIGHTLTTPTDSLLMVAVYQLNHERLRRLEAGDIQPFY